MKNAMKTLAAVSLIVLLGAGCQKQPDSNDNRPAAGTSIGRIAEGKMTVRIQENGEFDPVTSFVKKGTVITFENDTKKKHSVVPQEDAGQKFAGLDSKGEIAPGGRFSVTMDRAGRWFFSDGTNPAFGGAVEVSE